MSTEIMQLDPTFAYQILEILEKYSGTKGLTFPQIESFMVPPRSANLRKLTSHLAMLEISLAVVDVGSLDQPRYTKGTK